MAQNDSKFSAFLSYLWSRSNTKTGFASTVLAMVAALVWYNPTVLSAIGVTVPQIDSIESGVGQIVNLLIAIALFHFRGIGNTTEGVTDAVKLLALGVIVVACSAQPAFAQQAACNAVFSWVPPSQRTDGSALAVADIAEFQISEVSATGSAVVGKFAGNVTTGSLPILPSVSKQFAITAVDRAGIISALSAPPVSVTTYPIKAITDLQAKATISGAGASASADLTFTWTAATHRIDGTAIAATDIEYQLYEATAAGVASTKVATVTAPSATIAAVSGTKRYVVLAVAKPCSIASAVSNVQLVTTSAPKTPTLSVRLETKVAQQ